MSDEGMMVHKGWKHVPFCADCVKDIASLRTSLATAEAERARYEKQIAAVNTLYTLAQNAATIYKDALDRAQRRAEEAEAERDRAMLALREIRDNWHKYDETYDLADIARGAIPLPATPPTEE